MANIKSPPGSSPETPPTLLNEICLHIHFDEIENSLQLPWQYNHVLKNLHMLRLTVEN